jgi:hypothetical protein
VSDALDAAFAVIDAAPEGVTTLLLGGLAANAYRKVQRLTVDADLLLRGGIRSAGALERVLLQRGFARPPGKRVYRVGRFEWRRLLWPGDDPLAPSVVDLFFGDEGFLADVARRAVPLEIKGRPILIASPEDIVAFKLLAISSGRQTRGHKLLIDEDDLRSILSDLSGSLDVGYIREQAASLGVLRLANRHLREAGL